ncbi:MAG: glycosyltransferase family 2 protein [Pseudomonadota bacterium]
MASVRIITVTFNSSDVIDAFLESIPVDAELVVVDNASTDSTVETLAAHGIKPLAMDENLGFGTACNAGAKGARAPYLFFVNPDARLEPGCLDALTKAAETHPEAGAFNPAILTPEGKVRLNRRSCLLPPSSWTDKSLADPNPSISAEVRMLSGAALFCRRDAFEQIGGFDPNIFLYHEDDDLCVRLSEAGWTLRLEHSARVTHIGGAGTSRSLASAAFKSRAIARSRLYVETKHGIPHSKLKGYARGLSKLLSPLAWVSKRKRAQALAYLNAVWTYPQA